MPLRSPTLRLRSGINVPDWLGMFSDGPSSAIPNHGFRLIENGLFKGSRVTDRPGMVSAFSVTGPVQGFVDAGDIGAAQEQTSPGPFVPVAGGGRYLYFSGIHTNGNNRVLLRYDTLLRVLEERTLGDLAPPAANYYQVRGLVKGSDGNIYVSGAYVTSAGPSADLSVVLKLTWGTPLIATTVFSFGPTMPKGEPGYGDDGPAPGVLPAWGATGSLVEDPSAALVFYGARRYNTALITQTDGKVYRNGVLDDTPSFVYGSVVEVAAYFAAFNGTIYGSWGKFGSITGEVTDTIRRRIAATNWTNLTMPASPLLGGRFAGIGDPVVFGTKLWVPGYYTVDGVPTDEVVGILSVTTGNVVTVERTVSSGSTFPVNLQVFNGKLYYLYTDNSFSYSKLGRFDGVSTWDDAHWTGTIDGRTYRPIGVRKAGDSLWGTALDADGNYWLIKSRGANTQVWAKVLNLSANTTATPFADFVDSD
jgi:hypothetical protein